MRKKLQEKIALRGKKMVEHGDFCAKCGSLLLLTLEHIVPYVFLKDYLGYKLRDSYKDEWNFQILCQECNQKKSNKMEFADPLFRKNFLIYLEKIPLSPSQSEIKE